MGTKEGVSNLKYNIVLVFYILMLTSISFMAISQLEYTGMVTGGNFSTMVGGSCGGATECVCGDYVNSNRAMDGTDALTGCSGTALFINASNIVVDCDLKNNITGDGTGYGIYNPGFDNVTLKNCIISNFSIGVYFVNNSNNCMMSKVSTNNNTLHGVSVINASNTYITLCTSWNNTENGLNIINTFNTTINRCQQGEASDGIMYNKLGVYVFNSSLTKITNRNDIWFNRNKGGILIANSSNTTINETNVLYSNRNYGICIINTTNTLMKSNFIVNNTGEAGICVKNSNTTNIQNSVILNNSKDGVYIFESFSTMLARNEIINNQRRGVYFLNSSPYNVVQEGHFINNGNSSTTNYDGYDLRLNNGILAENSEQVVVIAANFTNNGITLLNCPNETITVPVTLKVPSILANNFLSRNGNHFLNYSNSPLYNYDVSFNFTFEPYNASFIGLYFTNSTFIGGKNVSGFISNKTNYFNYTDYSTGVDFTAIDLIEAHNSNITGNGIFVDDNQSVAVIIKNSTYNIFFNNNFTALNTSKRVDFFHIFGSNNSLINNNLKNAFTLYGMLLISSNYPETTNYTAINNTIFNNTFNGNLGPTRAIVLFDTGGNNFTQNFINNTFFGVTEYIGSQSSANPFLNNNISNTVGIGADYIITRFGGSVNLTLETIAWLNGSVSNATGRVYDFTTLSPQFISVNDTGLPNFNSTARLIFPNIDCTFFRLLYNESYFTTLAALTANSTVVATQANVGGVCNPPGNCLGLTCINPTTLLFQVGNFSSWGIGSGGCVNLTDNSTFGNRVTQVGEDFFVNQNTTLCRDTYFVNDFNQNGVLIMNNSDIFLDCNASILLGNGTYIRTSGKETKAIRNTEGQFNPTTRANENVIIRNCNIRNFTNGIEIIGNGVNLTGFKILNNNITDMFGNGTAGTIDFSMIAIDMEEDLIARNFLIDNNRIERTTCVGNNCQSLGNIIFAEDGIFINNTASNNIIRNVNIPDSNDFLIGIDFIGAGIGAGPGGFILTNNNTIINNTIFNFTSVNGLIWGIGFSSYLGPLAGAIPIPTDNKVLDNNVTVLTSSSNLSAGIFIAGEGNVNVTGNYVCDVINGFGIASLHANVIPPYPGLETQNTLCSNFTEGKIGVAWFAQVLARKCGSGYAGVQVNITDLNGMLVFNDTTNALGLTDRTPPELDLDGDNSVAIIEYIVNSTGTQIFFTPHNITATDGSETFNINYYFNQSRLNPIPDIVGTGFELSPITFTFTCPPGNKKTNNGGGDSGRRTVRSSGTSCGNGICDPWENETLCLQDCRKPAPPTAQIIKEPEEEPKIEKPPKPEKPKEEEKIEKKFPWWILLVIALAILLGGLVYKERDWIKEKYDAVAHKPKIASVPKTKPIVIPKIKPVPKPKLEPLSTKDKLKLGAIFGFSKTEPKPPLKVKPKKVVPAGTAVIDRMIASMKSEGASEEDIKTRLKRLGWKDSTIKEHLKLKP